MYGLIAWVVKVGKSQAELELHFNELFENTQVLVQPVDVQSQASL
jgi:hypothetical protein